MKEDQDVHCDLEPKVWMVFADERKHKMYTVCKFMRVEWSELLSSQLYGHEYPDYSITWGKELRSPSIIQLNPD